MKRWPAETTRPQRDCWFGWLDSRTSVRHQSDAQLTGAIDRLCALSFLQGLLVILRDSGRPGLLLVLDGGDLQRVRTDVRDKGLNALRQWLDEVDGGRFPGFIWSLLAPLRSTTVRRVQRLSAAGAASACILQPRSALRQPAGRTGAPDAFDPSRLVLVGQKFATSLRRICVPQIGFDRLADDAYLTDPRGQSQGNWVAKVGVAPRIFLEKLVAEVLDRIDQFPDFDPPARYALTLSDTELTLSERSAHGHKCRRNRPSTMTAS